MKTLNSQRAFDKNLQEDDFVLVYQMGKVGSSTIETSLDAANIPSWHVHTFDDNEEFQIYRNTDDVSCFFDWHIRAAYRIMLAHRYRVLQKRDYLKIITLVRDPVATVVSRFFQDLHIQFIEGKKNQAIHRDLDATLDHLMDAFTHQMNFPYFTDWFERELKRNFSVDIMQYIKNPAQSHWRIEQSGRDVLLLKCENLNDLSNVLADYLEQPLFNFVSSNQADNKWYSELYRQFKQRFDFETIFHLYDAPLYQAVYSPQEISQFKEKWSAL